MDVELFMECEEEELEPWQQVDDEVEEDVIGFDDSYGQPVEDSSSPLPGYETPPPSSPPTDLPPSPTKASSPAHPVSSSSTFSSGPVPPPAPPTTSVTHISAPLTPPISAPTMINQAQPLILTQTAGGTFLLPAASGAGGSQPILFTQGFPGASLVLNLQPGQAVQPLTLIQSPSLGQLVRPNLSMSPILSQGQNRVGCNPPAGSAHPSPFTAMQLPTTLAFHNTTPGTANLQMTQVGGTNFLKLAGSPALSSSSANGVTRVAVISSSGNQTMISTAPTTSASAFNPTKVVMSVEDFYYGRHVGDQSVMKPLPLGIKLTFTCQVCKYLADNNLRLMQHVLQHSQLVGSVDQTFCRFCYRQFSTSGQLEVHKYLVHGPVLTNSMCRICEWAFDNEPTFLNHMKSNHKPGEMPYVCQVCSYRSSFYSDVLQHFSTIHKDSRFLLCIFCLKVTKNSVNFHDHLLRHQVSQAFHCSKCRLQFITLKEKMQHKQENHRSFRRPAQLEGLPPGSKVTIRTYGKVRRPTPGKERVSSTVVQPVNMRTEPTKPLQQRNIVISKTIPRPGSQKPGSSHAHRSSLSEEEKLICLECGTDVPKFTSHYPTYVKCLLCPYRTCCSKAYAAHMIQHHVTHSADQLPLHKRPPPCIFRLHCSDCNYQPKTADLMAEHLLNNPGHYSATCQTRLLFERDIQIFNSQEQPSSETKTKPDQNPDLLNPSWRSADCWRSPSEDEDEESIVMPFMEESGPHHLARNSDAIDFFNLVFPQSLIELITKETNNHVKTCRFLDPSFPDWVPVTTYEIKGFIGLVILMGIQNLPDLSQYWSMNQYDNSYTFYRAMSYKRFKQIAANIRMGSLVTDDCVGPNHPNDPLHIFRPMLDILGKAMWNAYRPNCCLTVDRALLPSLEDDNSSGTPNSKAQPQVWLLCDSKSGYCHRFFIQVGEKENQETGFTVVPHLVEDLQDKRHQLYLANSLASVPLMQKLLDQGIYASTSFPPPNPILPQELWNEGQLDKAGDFLQRQFGPLLATRWRDAKEMGCLSTNAGPGEADTVWRRSQTKVGALDPIDRPMAFRLLQENMRGVDICKQLLACNPLGGIPQDRHWRSLFWFLVNLSIVNAFIVLRESRKDNPPSWVQDGLFMQVHFRKRLGNQLAKCAQKSSDKVEVASSRPVKEEVVPKPASKRHRLAKISSISKRCRNCNFRNVRRESVYGCIICRVNLCNQPSCFWEFHGLSPVNRGSTRIGFSISDETGLECVEDNMDDAMAPVEDIDFSDDEDLDDLDYMDEESKDIKEDYFKETKPAVSDLNLATNGDIQQPTILAKEHDDGLTARQLRISLMALSEGVGQASRVFSTHTQLIQTWLTEAKKRLKQRGLEQTSDSDGDGRLITWVLTMREQQFLITESNLFQKVSMLKKKGSFSESFHISYDWAVNFLLQHELGIKSIGIEPTLTRTLPAFLDAKVKSFQRFTQRMVQVHKLSESSVAAMDELSLFVDMRLIQDEGRRQEALELTGTIPLITVYLVTLADGTMLPSLMLATHHLAHKDLPEFILLETVSESLSAEEALNLWINKVWISHLSCGLQPKKSMLVVDQHREHAGDHFLTAISGLGTLPALIPGGGSFNLHPLEMCMKPVLQRYMLRQWAKFTAEKPAELEEESSLQQLQVQVLQRLVDWLVEALTHLNKLQHMWKTSFNLTGLFKKEDEHDMGQKPGEIQLDLLKTLTETLLGADALKENPPHLPACDDSEGTEEVPGGQVLESPEEKQKNPEEKVLESTEEKQEEPRDDEVKEGDKETKEEELPVDEGKGDDAKSDDSEVEVKETKEDKEVNKERREYRIVIGEDVGDEWTVKSRTEGTDAGRDDNGVIDKS